MPWRPLLILVVLAWATTASSQEPIMSLKNASGTTVDKLWLFVHQGGFRFSPGDERNRRTDMNYEDQGTLYYEEDGMTRELKLAGRLSFENLPAPAGSIKKEHIVSRLAFVCDITDAGEETESYDVSADAMTLTLAEDEEELFESWEYRGLKWTPHIRFSALKDLPGADYSFTLSGFWVSIEPAE